MPDLEIFARKFYAQHLKTISKILYHSPETAEDVVQEAYLRAHKNLNKYDESKGSLQTWFNKILFSTLHDYQRNYQKSIDIADFDVEWCIDDSVYDFNVNTSSSLEEKIDSVHNERHRKILVLFYVLGYSAKEIADIGGGTVTNVTTICSRFKRSVE